MSTPKLGPRSPFRLLEAFIARKDELLAKVKDEGGRFEFRLLLGLLRRGRAEVAVAAAQSVTIHGQVAEIRQQLLLAVAPTDDTPGVVDDKEAEELLCSVAALGTVTRHHAGHLEQLAQ